jgi:hypothetical protein
MQANKQVHVRIPIERMRELEQLAEAYGFSATQLAGYLIIAAQEALTQSRYKKLTMPIELVRKEDVEGAEAALSRDGAPEPGSKSREKGERK